jgi:hypothetical protein
MLTVPVRDLPDQVLDLTLDGEIHRLRLRWTDRTASWVMDWLGQDDAPRVTGLRVSLGLEHLRQFPGRGLPPGELWAADPSGNLQGITRQDLPEGRVQLVYVPEAEV